MNESDYWAQYRTPARQREHESRQAAALDMSRARMAAREAIQVEQSAYQAAKKQEHDAFLRACAARREALARGEIVLTGTPSLTQIRTDERAATAAQEKQKRLAATGGSSDFVLNHLPRNDPKMLAYRATMFNLNTEDKQRP